MRHIYVFAFLTLAVSACSSSSDLDDRSSTDSAADDSPSGGDPGPLDPDDLPNSTITVGGPPSECQLYEFPIPVEDAGKHHPEGQELTYEYNPPAGGPDWEMWAEYGRYDEPVDRERLQHNLRHGAIVLVYRPDAPEEVISALGEALPLIPTPGGKYDADPACPSMGIMSPDPELDDTFAVLSFGWMLTSNCVPKVDDIVEFAERRIYEGEEKECWSGAWPVREPCFRYETVRDWDWTREVPEGEPVTYSDYPPSSGPYYPRTLAYGRYDVPVPAPYWVGILAKGGIVVLYRPDADPAMIESMKIAYDSLSDWRGCGTLTAMLPDPNLSTPLAMVSAANYLEAQCFRGWEMNMFVTSRRGWGFLDECEDGTYVPEVVAPEITADP